MEYKLPYLFGGGTTDDLHLATVRHVICLVDTLDAINQTKRLIDIAVDEIDIHDDVPELVLRVRLLLDCLRGRLDPDLAIATDTVKLLREFYPSAKGDES